MAIIVQSCSRKKDKFINRAWHSIGTEYIILYNGELALQQGLESVYNAYTENFWELLPVERFEAKDEIRLAYIVASKWLNGCLHLAPVRMWRRGSTSSTMQVLSPVRILPGVA